MTNSVLAIDIGGTKLAAAIAGDDGSLHRVTKRPTPRTDDEEELFAALLGVVGEVMTDDTAIVAVGVGCGGPLTLTDGLVSPLNIPAWRDFPLRDRLRRHFGSGVPVALANDAVAMALGEYVWGAGAQARAMLGIVVSTGVGGGLVLDGKAFEGPTGNAGHVGHVVVDPDGPVCACGGRGCLEAIARGPAIVAWARERGWQSGQGGDGVALVASARGGDAIALAALTRAGQALGIACASSAALMELEVITIGGGIAQAGDLLLAPAVAAFERHAGMDYVRRCRVVAAELGHEAGLVGAGVLAHQAAPSGTD